MSYEDYQEKPSYNNGGGNGGGYQKPNYNGGGGGNNWKSNNGGGGGGWKGNNNGGGGWKGNGGGGGKPWQKPSGDGQQGERRHEPPVENPELYLPYAVTANKDADQTVLDTFQRICRKLEETGFIVRVGGMAGVEELVERVALKHELYLPWKGFEQKESKLTYNNPLVQGIAKKFHPAWDSLKPPIQAFLSKNVRLLCGQNCTSLAMFMLCWSKDGADNAKDKTFETGNVGHAIAVAEAHRIPIFNLGKPGTEERLYSFLGINNG